MEERGQGQETVLGLDIGANSVGWALVKLVDGTPVGLAGAGVRIFSAGVEGDVESGKDQSRAVKRREARLRRRMLDRTSRRLKKLALLLQGAGLLPPDDLASPEARNRFFAELDRTLFPEGARKSSPHVLPYRLRARALDERLAPHELGRAFYHLGQRRGFLSNRRATTKRGKEKEEGEVKQAIGDLARKIEESGARTLGKYLSLLDPTEERIRQRWTSRQMYQGEFERIWSAQAPHHPDILTGGFKAQVHRAIFFQRPLKVQKHLIGECELEPGRKRAPWALLISQRFRLLQKVNDLRLFTPDGQERKVTPEERTTLAHALENEGDLKFGRIRKLLRLKDHDFNFERGGEKGLIGNRTGAELANIFGERWEALSPEEKDRIVEEVGSFRKEEALARRGVRAWGLDEGAAREFGELRLEDGYCNLSRVALKKLLPLMERGVQYATARKKLYGEPPPREPQGSLPSLVGVLKVRNPAVQRALTEVRKVVNGVVGKYGKPAFVRIELARDLRKSRQDRKKTWKRNLENRKAREESAMKLDREARIREPKPRDIEKWLLADECNWQCPYTGRTISYAALFGPSPQFDVEHIVPLDRCLDDSFFNKTLCYVEENRNVKGNRTPWEAYCSNPERWSEIIKRVSEFKGRAARAKLERFQLKDLESLDDFTTRQLNDTRYAARLAVSYLGHLYGAGAEGTDREGLRRVQAGRGQVTQFLRNEWGLNVVLGGGEKTREDHRHHGVDAVAIALTEARTVKMLSDAAKRARQERRRRFGRVEPPWPGFLDEVREGIDRTVVSHRVSRKVSGAMHEETIYSKPYQDEKGRSCVHVRKPLKDLGKSELDNIVDPAIKKCVLDRLGSGDPKKVFADRTSHPSLRTKDGREIPIHKVRIRKYDTTVPLGSGARERQVKLGSNHHVEVFEVKDKKGGVRWDGEVVSTYEAMRRLKVRETVVKREHGPGKKFLFSLAGGEIVEISKGDRGVVSGLYVIRTFSKGAGEYVEVEFVPITDARKKEDIKKAGNWKRRLLEPLRSMGCRKVLITPLGEVRRAND